MEQQTQMSSNGKSVIRRTEEEILQHLREQEDSGFSVKDYCEVSEINEATFYSWVKKYRGKSEDPAGFTAIEVVPTSGARPQLFAEVGGIRIYKEVSPSYLKSLL